VKQEFRDGGFEYFPTHKVLEVTLYYCVPRKDVNPLAHRLVDRFGSFAAVLGAPYETLLEVDGVGSEVATYLKLLEALYKRYMIESTSSHNLILSISDAKEYVQNRFLSEPEECVLLVCLNSQGRILYVNRLDQEVLKKAESFPMNIVKICLRADAAQVILAHNRLDRSRVPSVADAKITKTLHNALAHMDIELFDHFILADNEIFSMREYGEISDR
jgi:DNA repair protein RadC